MNIKQLTLMIVIDNNSNICIIWYLMDLLPIDSRYETHLKHNES